MKINKKIYQFNSYLFFLVGVVDGRELLIEDSHVEGWLVPSLLQGLLTSLPNLGLAWGPAVNEVHSAGSSVTEPGVLELAVRLAFVRRPIEGLLPMAMLLEHLLPVLCRVRVVLNLNGNRRHKRGKFRLRER